MKLSCALFRILSNTSLKTLSHSTLIANPLTQIRALSSVLSTILILLPCVSMARATLYAPRPQGHNAARESVGNMHRMLYKEDDKIHGTFAYGFEYSQSWRPDDITMSLFENAHKTPCGCGITISGSAVANRGATDWMADYFGLPTDFQSTVAFKPSITNLIAPITYHLGLDEWIHGLYFTVELPLVHTQWTLNPREHIVARGSNSYPLGYFAEKEVPRSDLLQNFLSFASNEKVPTLSQSTDYIPVTFRALDYGKMSCSRHTRTRFADITAILGWNFIEREAYHIGMNFRSVMPTGNTPKGYYLFEPMVGNGHHWELGYGMTSHWDFWQNKTEDRRLTAHIDASTTHFFSARQKRVFDLKDKPYSRYMLMEQMQDNSTSTPRLSPIFPKSEFSGMLTPLANLSAFNVNVNVSLQADLVALLSYSSDTCSFDIGYNLWMRGCEKIDNACQRICALPSSLTSGNTTIAQKGNAYVIGFEPTTTYTATRLGATQNNATIYNGTNPPSNAQNSGIDNATTAVSNYGNILETAPASGLLTRSSNPLIFPSTTNLDLSGAQTRSLTHKIFAHLEHTWIDRIHWTPHIGLGGEIEFGENKSCCTPHCATTCTSCAPCSLSQWGVWVLSGISF